MEVLCIGNSFSQDATRYVYEIARKDGEKINIVNLYSSGCSLERHCKFIQTQEVCYGLEINGQLSWFWINLKTALKNRAWDVITVQQASKFSADFNSYVPFLETLVSYVKEHCPNAKIYVHQTWAYENGSEMLQSLNKYNTSSEMTKDIVVAYDKAVKLIGASKIIRSGELFDALLKNGIKNLYRDTYHASLGLGRYALGLLWYGVLFDKDVTANKFKDFDEKISKKEIEIIKTCVNNILKQK